jgi:hypothetical protein
MTDQRLGDVLRRGGFDPEYAGCRAGDLGGVGECRQTDQPHPVREALDLLGGGTDSEAHRADPAGAGQRHQAMRG